MIFTDWDVSLASSDRIGAEGGFPVLYRLSFDLYQDDGMSRILVAFMKRIVRNFVSQTEALDGAILWYALRFIADEQMLKITAAIYNY